MVIWQFVWYAPPHGPENANPQNPNGPIAAAAPFIHLHMRTLAQP